MSEQTDSLEEGAASLPTGPGVYLFKAEDGSVLYVGKAQNLRSRVRQYLSGGDGRIRIPALVDRAALVLSNDTGPRHIAVALRRPVVVLIGPTSSAHTAMHLENQRVLRHDVDCSPCQLKVCPIDHRCMTGLLPERAVTAARELLAG